MLALITLNTINFINACNIVAVAVTATVNAFANDLLPDPEIGAEENGCLPNITLPTLLLHLGLNLMRLV